jgi:thiol-disulfide isomerase/thioredoxin
VAVYAALLVGCSKSEPAASGTGPGQEVNLQDLLVKGKTTLLDFYSPFCPPCRQIAPKLEALDSKREDLVVVKVDINRPGVQGIDWQSPAARQFRLSSIPHFKIYGPDGKLEAEGDPAYEKVLRWLQ